eukprot:TRINITY_DN54257_c0_g1_i1.p1 TRINITY_DN54257_c0_g1~~TRINITY_DN54257_c0_g1_i1.p1  ORF type:complete len:284 (+),score=71.83 TRINITY_DN54257_c0_g1_i1:50-853(+)
MAASSDPLQVLGLKPGCKADEVTRAFRRLARQNHPDKGGSKEAFQRIRAAYEELSKDGGLAAASRARGPARQAPAEERADAERKARAWAQAQKDAAAAREARAARRARQEKQREKPTPEQERGSRAWDRVRKDSTAERRAQAAYAAERASMPASERRRDENRKRKRQQEEEEMRYPEEWQKLKEEQAARKMQQQAQLAKRRAVWAAQHNAHVAGLSLDFDLELHACLQRLQRAQRLQSAQASSRSDPQAKPMARVLQKKTYRGARLS